MNFIQGEKFKKLTDNNKIFYCDTHDVNDFFNRINFEHDFILVSHNSDGKITDNPNKYDADVNKIPNNLKKWYGQNVSFESDIIESIPIGLENSEWFVHERKIHKLTEIIKTPKNIKNLIYLNLNIANNVNERLPIYEMLKNKKYVTTEYGRNGLNYDSYLNNLYNHTFMVCPEGNGIDVHQPWESMYINTIPIQKKNINNSNWRELPVCWLDDWSQMEDESFLISEYERIIKTKFDKSKLDFNYWVEKIKST
jgi:hypothetical protein